MALSLLSTPAVVTQASTSLSQSHTASAVCDVFLCVSQRGGTAGSSPTSVSYGGVAVHSTPGPASDLAEIAGSTRAHRWYHLPKGSHPGTGSRTVAVSWAGVDNIGVCIVEIGSSGTVSVAAQNAVDNQGGTLNVPITASSGDVTLACAQGNSASPGFTPQSGQTEYAESAWYSNTGHSIGYQTGAQTGANWTAAGSTCGSAIVLREASGATSHDAVGASSLSNAGQAALSQNHQLAAAGASSLSSTGLAALSQNHQFEVAGIESDSSTGEAVYGHVFAAEGTESDSEMGEAALTQSHQLVASGASSTSQTGQGVLSQNHQLAAAGAVSASRTGSARLDDDGGGDGEGALGSSTLGIGVRIRRHVIGG